MEHKGTSLAEIGARLAEARNALGLRPVDVCRDMDVKQNAYSQWEAGKRRPNLDNMFKFSRLYHITLDWIYLGDPSGLPYHISQKLMGKTSPTSEFSDTAADIEKAG